MFVQPTADRKFHLFENIQKTAQGCGLAFIEHTERGIHRRADLTLGIRTNENPRKDNYFVTAKDQSECQFISGTKQNKKR